MARSVSSVEHEYEVRRYKPGDRDDIIALYEQVFGGDGHAWFSWKYEDNPYVDHVPMTVATTDGTVVAIKPTIAFRVCIGDEQVLALQPADVMVHPDHRRRGLYSRTTEHLQRVYADGEPELFFNFPNEATLSGSLKHGWRTVQQAPTAYRIQRPPAMLDDDASLMVRAGARVLGTVWRVGNRIRDRRHLDDERVTRYDRIPVSTLATLAKQGRPRGIHALRDPRYLSWRFENPEWSYATYLTGTDEAYAAIVVGERRTSDQYLVALTDVYPPDTQPRAEAIERLVGAIVADHRKADALVADGQILPPDVCQRAGFRMDDRRPLDRFASPSTLVTCPATGVDPDEDDWVVAGLDITNPDSWNLSLAERDTW
jgi:hypothetical protein